MLGGGLIELNDRHVTTYLYYAWLKISLSVLTIPH